MITKKRKITVKYLEELFSKYMLVNGLFSIVMILIGLILYVYPSIAIKTVSWIIGLIFITIGVLSIYSYFKKESIRLLTFNLTYGVLSIVLGLLVLINPFAIANILTFGLGIWLIISGSLKVSYGISLKNIKEEIWLLTLVIGIISIVFGLMVILNPFSKLIIVGVVGLFLVVYGIIDLVNVFLLKKRCKKFIKLFK